MTNFEKYKTAEERSKAFRKYHDEHYHDCRYTVGKESPIDRCVSCLMEWLEKEYEEEKPLPCPFCGGETRCAKEWNGLFRVVCTKTDCWYSANTHAAEESAIAAHNRVARAAKTNLQ